MGENEKRSTVVMRLAAKAMGAPALAMVALIVIGTMGHKFS